MKKIPICLLILTILCAIPFSFAACKRNNGAEIWDPSKYKESIDLSGYERVFYDEFDGELDRTVWGDTRQGTRRDGFWTKNLAYTDGDGHLVIRTEKRGSRTCSDTKERQVTAYNGSIVTLRYDDCYPFGAVAGDFGDLANLTSHTSDLVGLEILSNFDSLAKLFSAYIGSFAIPAKGNELIPALNDVALDVYAPFYEKAMRLFNYYSFVVDTKTVESPLYRSAVIGLNRPYMMAFGLDVSTQTVDFRAVLASLFGFSSARELADCAERLASICAEEDVPAGIENGSFRAENGSFLFPIAFRNEVNVVLTYVIVDADGLVSAWVNDVTAALRATNYNGESFTGGAVTNETYCKNVLFVTGPEGVYSGALRTRDLYTHGFGYYEIRCKLPDVKGIWHAFWMMCGDVYNEENGSEDGIEIDVFEYLPARDAVNCALHWDGYDEAHKNAHKRFEKTGLADGNYHIFGMNWDENGYAFYIDGKKVYTTTGGGICKSEGYMKISTEYGEWGDWVGTLDLGELPVDWVIDYVKIYDKK